MHKSKEPKGPKYSGTEVVEVQIRHVNGTEVKESVERVLETANTTY